MKINYKFKNKIIKKIFNLSKKTNTPLFLVGGIVRDILLEKSDFNDIDFVYKNNIDFFIKQLKEKIKFKTIEFNRKSFRTIRLCFKNLIIDFQKLHSDDIKKDSNKRDFTVNSLYMKHSYNNNYEIIDYVDGIKHIKDKVIVPVSENSFKDDPLRILRMYRLKSTDNFKLSQKAIKLANEVVTNLEKTANERIKDELVKIFEHPDKKVLKKMTQTGVFEILFNHNFKNTNINTFKNDSLLNIVSFFYENGLLKKLPAILDTYTFSKKDSKLAKIINNILADFKTNIAEKKFISKNKDYPKKYLQKALIFIRKINPEINIINYLEKIIQNYKFKINGNILMQTFNVKGEELGKLIDKMHTFQIKEQIKKSDVLLNQFKNNYQK